MRATEELHDKLAALSGKLRKLSLRIDDVAVRASSVSIATYPDGPRPTSTVTLTGRGASGYGEHVGWTGAEHEAFGASAGAIAKGQTTVGAWSRTLASLPPYDRAALEAAAVDLALRQHHTTLFELAGVAPPHVRYVVSFAPGDDPVADARRFGHDETELKIDADPAWNEQTWHAIATATRIAIVDFKLRGEAADHELAFSLTEGAWIEDPKPGTAPWSPALLNRLAADAAVTSVAALTALRPQPAAVNVKAPRMGGVLEAIDCLAACAGHGIQTYIGGMFEIGIGRRQSLVLAALACPDAPNDIAPLGTDAARPPRLVVPAGLAGFAGDPA